MMGKAVLSRANAFWRNVGLFSFKARSVFACLEMFKTTLDVHDTTIVPLERTKSVPLSQSCQTTLKERAV